MPAIARKYHLLRTRQPRVPWSSPRHNFSPVRRGLATSALAEKSNDASEAKSNGANTVEEDGRDGAGQDEEKGAMTRRFEQLSESALESGGRSARKAVEEAGFSQELRQQLKERIAGANFRTGNAQALASASLPPSAGRGTRDIASAAPWTGTESVEDASLRMLNDAYKPMKVPVRIPRPTGPPDKVDTGRPSSRAGSGNRLLNARDRSSVYSSVKDSGMSPEEREQFFKEMKARFEPGARNVPATLQGLASLANERIEDAIARGQFKNLPRGQRIERDYNANSPFIDTTEYFMNKMIQKQDIVPPWIEKQQELTSTVTKFRARLRNDWKRHAARSIASRGGTLDEQIRRAEAYARAEAIVNPSKKPTTEPDRVHMSQISMAGELSAPAPPAVKEEVAALAKAIISGPPLTSLSKQASPSEQSASTPPPPLVEEASQAPDAQPSSNPNIPPFRDPAWEKTENSFLTLSIQNLNNLTRTYNLIAPAVAQKPYYNLARELRNCYADVAPLLAAEIRERARAPPDKFLLGSSAGRDGRDAGRSGRGVLEGFGGHRAVVHDEDLGRKGYGFKEFWRDLWTPGG